MSVRPTASQTRTVLGTGIIAAPGPSVPPPPIPATRSRQDGPEPRCEFRRIPATYSDLIPATDSDAIPATHSDPVPATYSDRNPATPLVVERFPDRG